MTIYLSDAPAGRVLDRLENVKRAGDGQTARCPAHEDRRNSLSIGQGADGRVLLNCHAGCTFEEIVAALGLEASDLFPTNGTAPSHADGFNISATYDYTDEDGEMLFQAVRLSPKDFRQRKPDGAGGWEWNVQGVPRVPYRLPEVAEKIAGGRLVVIVEGEKDADRLAEIGVCATTNPAGAGKWSDALSQYFKGARVAILPDNDDAGRTHAESVAQSLHEVASDVRVVQLPGLAEKGDVSDWLDAGGDAEQLARLVETAPEWSADEATPEDGIDAFAPTLARLLEDPARFAEPVPVVPRLAYRGAATLVVSPPKTEGGTGKSTLHGGAVAALSRAGEWLDSFIFDAGRSVVLAPDEPAALTIRRLHEMGADPERVRVVLISAPDPLGRLVRVLDEWPADLVVVDSLSEYGRLQMRQAPDLGDASAWGTVVRPLVALAHDRDLAVNIIHHSRREDGQYRGSGEIAAAVDMVVTMRAVAGDETARQMDPIGRWPAESWSWRLEGGRIVAAGGAEPPLGTRLLQYVSRHPGCSSNDMEEGIHGRAQDIRAERDRLHRAEILVCNAGPRGAHEWHLTSSRTSSGGFPQSAGNETTSSRENMHEHGADEVGTSFGTRSALTSSRVGGTRESPRDEVADDGRTDDDDFATTFECESGCGARVGGPRVTCATCNAEKQRAAGGTA